MKSNPSLGTLDYNSPAVPRITLDRLRAKFFLAGRIAAIGAIACSAVTLWAGRLPPPAAPLTIFGVLIGIGSAGLWIASAAIEIVVLRVGKPQRRKATLLLVFTPVLLAGTWALLASGLPWRLVFRANKPVMDRWVQTFLATPPPGPPPWAARIGSYQAYNVESIPGGVKFFVEGSGFFRSGGGFAYSPAGPPAAVSGPAYETYTYIGGAWYAWTFEEP